MLVTFFIVILWDGLGGIIILLLTYLQLAREQKVIVYMYIPWIQDSFPLGKIKHILIINLKINIIGNLAFFFILKENLFDLMH